MEDVNHRETRYTLAYIYICKRASRSICCPRNGPHGRSLKIEQNPRNYCLNPARAFIVSFWTDSRFNPFPPPPPVFNTLPFALVSFPSSARDDCLRFGIAVTNVDSCVFLGLNRRMAFSKQPFYLLLIHCCLKIRLSLFHWNFSEE